MHLKNQYPLAELTSENPIEAQSLLQASMRSYSPRSAGIAKHHDERRLILGVAEIPEFIKGIGRDVTLPQTDKRSITKLLKEFMAGKIQDEAFYVW